MNSALSVHQPPRVQAPSRIGASPQLMELADAVRNFGWSMQASTLLQFSGLMALDSTAIESVDTALPVTSEAHANGFFKLGDMVISGLGLDWKDWTLMARAYRYKHSLGVSGGSAQEVVDLYEQVLRHTGRAPVNTYDFHAGRESMVDASYESKMQAGEEDRARLKREIQDLTDQAHRFQSDIRDKEQALQRMSALHSAELGRLEQSLGEAIESGREELASTLAEQREQLLTAHSEEMTMVQQQQERVLAEKTQLLEDAKGLYTAENFIRRDLFDSRTAEWEAARHDIEASNLRVTIAEAARDEHAVVAESLRLQLQSAHDAAAALQSQLEEMSQRIDQLADERRGITTSELDTMKGELVSLQKCIREEQARAKKSDAQSHELRKQLMLTYNKAQSYVEALRKAGKEDRRKAKIIVEGAKQLEAANGGTTLWMVAALSVSTVLAAIVILLSVIQV